MSTRSRRAYQAAIDALDHGRRVVQCIACGWARSWIDALTALRLGWSWELGLCAGRPCKRWVCPDCGGCR